MIFRPPTKKVVFDRLENLDKKKSLDIIYQLVYYVSKVKGFENEQG